MMSPKVRDTTIKNIQEITLCDLQEKCICALVHKIVPCRCWGRSLGNTNFQLCPQIFHWIEVQRPVRPIQNLEMFFMWSSSLVAQALRLGSLSSWWFQLRFILNALTDSRRHLPKNLTIHRPVYPFLNPDQLSCHI